MSVRRYSPRNKTSNTEFVVTDISVDIYGCYSYTSSLTPHSNLADTHIKLAGASATFKDPKQSFRICFLAEVSCQ